jgi:hypothetical protein
MLFIVKPNVDISKYGFVRREDRSTTWCWWRKTKYGRRGMNMHFYEKDRRITVQSASSDCIAVLCKMYKNGDMEIHEELEYTNMKLTKEEVAMIEKMRSEL